MTPEKLDLFLHSLTDHEKKYKSGWQNPLNYASLETVELKNKPIKIRRFQNKNLVSALSGGRHSRFSSYPAHIHPWVELNYMYAGSCEQKVNGNKVLLKQGQTLLLDQNTIHDIPILGENDILLNIYISKDYLTTSFFNRFSQNNLVSQFLINSITNGLSHDNYLFFASENRRRLPMFISEFFCEVFDPSECSEDIMSNLFSLILVELMETSRNTSMNAESHSSVFYILKYIEKNYKDATLTSTAEFFNLNPDYLSRLLKKRTGSSFQTLLTKQRMLTAKQLLLNGSLPVREVASQVGYDNITFFYKKFREEYQLSPGNLKNHH